MMMGIIYGMCLFVWILIGARGFVYWWTHDHDFTSGEMPLMIALSWLGPITWIVGWFIHGDGKLGNTVIKKKRVR